MKRTVAPIILSLSLFLFSGVACAELRVVATLPWIGSIAGGIGKDRVSVTTLVKPSQDPHYIEAKPSMILAARKADILMYNGLDLEAGYLPALIESSRNQKIQPGRPGNLDCSRFITPIEKPSSVDRSLGDVHPLGNPHYHLSVRNMKAVVAGIAAALAAVDPANGAFYRENGGNLVKRIEERQKAWSTKSLKGKKYIAYHKFFEYAAREYGFELVGYVEAKPGIPPSSGHLEGLIELAGKTKIDGIIATSSSPRAAADFLARKTGCKVVVLPQDVGSMAGTEDWVGLMDVFIATLP